MNSLSIITQILALWNSFDEISLFGGLKRMDWKELSSNITLEEDY